MTEKKLALDAAVVERAEALVDLTAKMLSRDDILGAPELPLVEVDIPEWGGTVWVKPMTAAGRDAFEASVADDNGKVDKRNFRAKLVVRCVVDHETGVRLFQDDDAKAIGAKSAMPVDRIFEAAAKASGLTPEDLVGLEGNSEGRDGDSSSD